ncbi:MAG: structural hemagglutinin/hemolysin toxin protein RtxA [bacterium]|jgi:structural hemagglutinin/hemolysin toxin protein RtxA
MYKLVFFVPKSHLEVVKQAVFQKGAGHYKGYDRCSWETLGNGQFRPLESSNPFIGKQGEIENVEEFRVEMICKDHLIYDVVKELIHVHPYEEPGYSVFPILTFDDLTK